MPREHRRQMLGSVFAAALSTTYFVTLGILLQPIPSRNLAAHVPMPTGTVSNVEFSSPDPVIPTDMLPLLKLRGHAVRPMGGVQRASLSELSARDSRNVSAAVQPEQRRSFLSRFFHGVIRTVQLKNDKGDAVALEAATR